MELFLLLIGALNLVVLLSRFWGFDDPKPMSNLQLLSAIAKQADWLEKVSASPIESQNSTSIIKKTRKRRDYIACLCLEVLSRDAVEGQLKCKGAIFSIGMFSAEAAQFAKELEDKGVSKENAAVQAVKANFFVPSGMIYPTRWEV